MATRFMTDPDAMRSTASRFDVHAQDLEDANRRMWAATQNISGVGWSGQAQMASLDTMSQMNQAFNNIRNLLNEVRQGLHANANNYENQELQSRGALGS